MTMLIKAMAQPKIGRRLLRQFTRDSAFSLDDLVVVELTF